MGEKCCMHGKGEKCAQKFFWKNEGKQPRGRPRRRLENNIKVDGMEIGCEIVN
jgi:hypothetical protein